MSTAKFGTIALSSFSNAPRFRASRFAGRRLRRRRSNGDSRNDVAAIGTRRAHPDGSCAKSPWGAPASWTTGSFRLRVRLESARTGARLLQRDYDARRRMGEGGALIGSAAISTCRRGEHRGNASSRSWRSRTWQRTRATFGGSEIGVRRRTRRLRRGQASASRPKVRLKARRGVSGESRRTADRPNRMRRYQDRCPLMSTSVHVCPSRSSAGPGQKPRNIGQLRLWARPSS